MEEHVTPNRKPLAFAAQTENHSAPYCWKYNE